MPQFTTNADRFDPYKTYKFRLRLPDGDYIAFTSGRTGEGDNYVYSFFTKKQPMTRITFEETGYELYPTWSPDGSRLAFIGHLGVADHLFLVDDV